LVAILISPSLVFVRRFGDGFAGDNAPAGVRVPSPCATRAHPEPAGCPRVVNPSSNSARRGPVNVTRTGPSNILYMAIGALVVIAAGLAYYVYDQSQRGPEVEIRLEVPKIPTTN
jgi:hypothetical protein